MGYGDSKYGKRYEDQLAEPPKVKKPQVPEKNRVTIQIPEKQKAKASMFNFSNLSLIPKMFNSGSPNKKSKSQKSLVESDPPKSPDYPSIKESLNSLTLNNTFTEDTLSFETVPSTESQPYRVVILGASIAGISAAKNIVQLCKNQAKITIIEPQEKCLIKPAILSAVMDYTTVDSLIIPYNSIFSDSKNRIIRAKPVSISPTHVTLHNQSEIPFDSLIIATGLSYPCPVSPPSFSLTATNSMLKSFFIGITNSKCILVIGGGPTGCEAAERIVTEFLGKSVVLIHDRPMLLDSNYPSSYRKKLAERLIKFGVDVILNDHANIDNSPNYGYPPKGRWIETKSQKMLFSDIQINCSGGRGNSEFLKSLSSKSSSPIIDPETSCINVNINLQVSSYNNIFAIGDVNNIDGIKNIERARSQAATVSKTIKQYVHMHLKGKDPYRIRPYAWVPDSKAAYDSLVPNSRSSPVSDSVMSFSIGSGRSKSSSSEPYYEQLSTRKLDEIKLVRKIFSHPII
ncbi:Apoptosis-inducing factor-like protein [Smittium mucronatum]|uniref:Apoptosis-inducing factor-like protein n=1 Tax=Smittium mucronatum TaxID=133383 RepID=A0A1R0H3E8_9FUNG|nr:Apoptosis-inducing factor-like protein [Smittium mucronatum]